MSIMHLEMLNILVAIKIWGSHWYGKAICIYCDNEAVLSVLNMGRTKDFILAAIACNIFMAYAKYDISKNSTYQRFN